jgi:biotin transport system permease protein
VSRPAGLFQTHVPGNSIVHRAPLWLKFAAGLLVGVTTFALNDWRQSLAVLGAVLLAQVASGVGARRLLHSVRPLLPLLVVLGAFHWWSHDLAYAVRLVVGIVAAFTAAGLLTATTPMDRILDGVVAAARPLRRWVEPETLALTIAVMLRSIPWITGAFADVREAARARGLERSPRALLLPVVIHTVAYARTTGDALAARGLGDPEPSHDAPR